MAENSILSASRVVIEGVEFVYMVVCCEGICKVLRRLRLQTNLVSKA